MASPINFQLKVVVDTCSTVVRNLHQHASSPPPDVKKKKPQTLLGTGTLSPQATIGAKSVSDYWDDAKTSPFTHFYPPAKANLEFRIGAGRLDCKSSIVRVTTGDTDSGRKICFGSIAQARLKATVYVIIKNTSDRRVLSLIDVDEQARLQSPVHPELVYREVVTPSLVSHAAKPNWTLLPDPSIDGSLRDSDDTFLLDPKEKREVNLGGLNFSLECLKDDMLGSGELVGPKAVTVTATLVWWMKIRVVEAKPEMPKYFEWGSPV